MCWQQYLQGSVLKHPLSYLLTLVGICVYLKQILKINKMTNPETPPTLGTRHGTNSNKAKNTTQKTKKMSKMNTNKNLRIHYIDSYLYVWLEYCSFKICILCWSTRMYLAWIQWIMMILVATHSPFSYVQKVILQIRKCIHCIFLDQHKVQRTMQNHDDYNRRLQTQKHRPTAQLKLTTASPYFFINSKLNNITRHAH